MLKKDKRDWEIIMIMKLRRRGREEEGVVANNGDQNADFRSNPCLKKCHPNIIQKYSICCQLYYIHISYSYFIFIQISK